MLAVLLFLAVSLVFVSVNQHRLSSILRVERRVLEAERVRSRRGASHGTGLGTARNRPACRRILYACEVTLSTPSGNRSFAVQFASSGAGQWSISVAPVDPAGSLPPLPATFAH